MHVVSEHLTAVLILCFLVYVVERFVRVGVIQENAENLLHEKLHRLKTDLELHEKAIKNLSEQCVSEISKLKDRMGVIDLKNRIGSNPKEGQ